MDRGHGFITAATPGLDVLLGLALVLVGALAASAIPADPERADVPMVDVV